MKLFISETCFCCKRQVDDAIFITLGSKVLPICISCDDKIEREVEEPNEIVDEAFI